MDDDRIKYMQRCLQLAKLGEGLTESNPMVGCVIVHDGRIIGEGYHHQYGGPHAEVNAIRSVKEKNLLAGSTLYVNLEPCSHTGKTPPCSDLIIEKQIPRVVIGTMDPFPEVSGMGIEKLRKSGCGVEVGVLSNECQELNRRFFTFHREKRPYIILKWAQTADGFIDKFRGDLDEKPLWITDEIARVAVHKQRAVEGAILVGTETAVKDNPCLTLRDWSGRQPLRIVTDMNNRLPSELNIFDRKVKTIVLSKDIRTGGNNLHYLPVGDEDAVSFLLHYLYSERILSIVVEGGTYTLQQFLDRNVWDEAHVYVGKTKFHEGVEAPLFDLSRPVCREIFPQSELLIFRNLRE